MTIPENHVVTEGRTLRAAIDAAATSLGVPAALVEHKVDMAHFRSTTGQGVGMDTVKIFAWARDASAMAPLAAAEAWMKTTLATMERTGTVRAELRGDAVVLLVDVGEEGRHLVGRGGATLKSLQHLLTEAMATEFPGRNFRIDVARGADEGERREERSDRGERRDDRGDRGDRGGRDRDRGERGGRDRDRGERGGRDRGDRGDRGGDRGGRDEGELKKLARKLALKVQETGNPEVIRRELNGYERRLVHVEVQEVAGVKTRSIGEGSLKKVEIYKDGDAAGEE